MILFFITFSIQSTIIHGQSGAVPVADGFDYPIGNKGYVGEIPVSIPENISFECNNLFPSHPKTNPSRGGTGTGGWYNLSDVGNFVTDGQTDGIHPGEDWNFGSGCADSGKSVLAVGNGEVLSIEPTWSGGHQLGGWTIVIKHTLPSGEYVYSIYSHITSANETEGDLSNTSLAFTVSDTPPNNIVERGEIIGRVAKGNNCNSGNMMSGIPTHLHFEMRNNNYSGGTLYRRDNGYGYYGGENDCVDFCDNSGRHTDSINEGEIGGQYYNEVSNAFKNMQRDGIIDPSDFIDAHRPGKINQGLDIYAGDVNNTKTISVSFHTNLDNPEIANFFIGDPDPSSQPTFTYSSTPTLITGSVNRYQFTVQIPSNVAGYYNNQTAYDIRFDIVSGNEAVKAFGDQQLYFLQPNYHDLGFSNNSEYYTIPYLNQAIWQGFYQGGPIGNINGFGNLSRAEAAKVVTLIGLKSGLFDELITTPSGTMYGDISPCDWVYPYIRTLISNGVFSGSGDFQPDTNMKYGELCHWLIKAFPNTLLPNAGDNNFIPYPFNTQCATNPAWKAAMDDLENTYAVVEFLDGRSSIEPIGLGALLNTQSPPYNFLPDIDCNMNVKRGDAARLFVNAYMYLTNNNANTQPRAAASQDTEWNTLGSKLRLPGNSTSQTPSLPTTQNTIEINDNEVWTLPNAGPLTDNNGNPLAYYWAIQGGELISLNDIHSLIQWSPPDVSQPETFDLYLWMGNTQGNYVHTVIPITVNPSSGSTACTPPFNLIATPISNTRIDYTWESTSDINTYTIRIRKDGGPWELISGYTGTFYPDNDVSPCSSYEFEVKANCSDGSSTTSSVTAINSLCQYPTQQATDLTVTSVNQFSQLISLNWTRGNGDGVVIVADEFNNNGSYDYPVDLTWYDPLANFQDAPLVSIGSSSKVVYRGQGSSTNVINLENGKVYLFRAFEYVGDAEGNVLYLTNPPSVTALMPDTPPVNPNFEWIPAPVMPGVATEFIGYGDWVGDGSWSFTGANINSAQGLNVENVIFDNPGSYDVTFTGENTLNGATEGITKTIHVLDPNLQGPDLVVSSITLSQSTVMQDNEVEITVQVKNIGNSDAIYPWTSHYLSLDQVLDGSDYYFDQDNYQQSAVIPGQSSYTYTTTLTIPDANDWNHTGQVYFLVEADRFGNIAENNETNNIESKGITVENFLPDIIMGNINSSESTIPSGGEFTLSYTISSSPCCYSELNRLYLSEDSQLDNFPTDYDLGNIPNGSSSIQKTIPGSAPDGSYYLIAVADYTDQQPETNEDNNISIIPITINSPNQPIADPTNIQISNISDGNCTVSWIPASNSTILHIDQFDTPSFPCDGEFYSADTDFLQAPDACTEYLYPSQVTYFGSGSSASIINLPGETDIRIRPYSANVYNGGSNVNYYQSSQNPYRSDKYHVFKAASSNSVINNWEHLLYQETLDIDFIDENEGKAISSSWLYSTEDGGKVWRANLLNGLTGRCLEIISSSIVFVGGNTNGIGEIHKSTDGGSSWQTVYSSGNLFGDILDIKFATPEIGFAVDLFGRVLKTSDGGSNWNIQYQSNGLLRDVSIVDTDTIFVGGNNGKILLSNDGGGSWEIRQLPGSSGDYEVTSLFFERYSKGWVGGATGKVWKTEDGGDTWEEIISDGSWVEGIEKLGSTYFIISHDQILRSWNGGDTWTNLTKPNSFPTYSYYIDDSKFFLTPSGGGIFRYSGDFTGLGDYQIAQPVLQGSDFCVGENVHVSAQVGNTATYFVELSDENGQFSYNSPRVVGQFDGNGSESVNVILPTDVIPSSSYQIRIFLQSPVNIFSPPSSAFSIQTPPSASINNLPSFLTTLDDPVILSGMPAGGNFFIDGAPVTQFDPSALGPGSYEVVYNYNNGTCQSTVTQYVDVVPAQSIAVNLVASSVCAGSSISLIVDIQGDFSTLELFNIQLSDANGSFTNPTDLETFLGQQSGLFQVNIPNYFSQGSNYQIRVISSSGINSNLAGPFTITPPPVPQVSIIQPVQCNGDQIQLEASISNGGPNPSIKWYVDNNLFASNTDQINLPSSYQGSSIYVELISNATCSNSAPVVSFPISIDLDCSYPPCEGNLTINDQPIPENAYHAQSTIESAGQVNTGSSVTFTAGNSISLLPGFHAEAGSDFHALIGDCQAVAPLAEHEGEAIQNNQGLQKQVLSLEVFPNPFRNQTTIRYHIPEASLIRIKISDFSGKTIKTPVNNEWHETGSYDLLFKSNGYSPGMYFVTILAGDGQKTKRMVVVQ